MPNNQAAETIDDALCAWWRQAEAPKVPSGATVDAILAALAAAGLHVVPEGHAVHDGQVWALDPWSGEPTDVDLFRLKEPTP